MGGNYIVEKFTRISSIGLFPENIVKVNINKTLFVNAWDPLTMVGNGNNMDESLDGYVGRNTYAGILCNPLFNLRISYQPLTIDLTTSKTR